MGRIGVIKDWLKKVRGNASVRRVKADTGGNYTATGDVYQPAGDDAAPLLSDYVIMVKGVNGQYHAVGFLDPKNANIAEPGGRRIYARNASGSEVASVYVKPDGEVEIKNALGNFKMLPTGVVNINGAIIGVDGSITSPVSVGAPTVAAATSLTVAGTEVGGHVHVAGTPPGDTGVMKQA